MWVWSVLALFALGAVSEDAVTSSQPTSPHYVKDAESIPYANGGDQVFETTAELIQSFRRQKPEHPELPAVIPSGQQLLAYPTSVPSADLEVPLETSNTPLPTIGTPESTPGLAPPRPTFSRSLHLRDQLTVPGSDYTEVYDIAWHADSDTARTVVENSTTVYRAAQPDGQVQFLKIEQGRPTSSGQRICTRSPSLPASPKDKAFPGIPDIEPFRFIGYTTEDGRQQVENWQHVVVGKPGEGGAARGESLNFTHDFILYREGRDAVPLRYTVVTDSSVLGPVSDTYTHRYTLLPAPTAPILPNTDKECDKLEEFQAGRPRREKPPHKVLDAKQLEDILTPSLL